MRIRSVIPFAALVVLSLSCRRETLPPAPLGEPLSVVTASFADGGSKTVLGDDLTSVLWSPNDEISIFYNGDGVKFTSLNSTPKPVVDFVSRTAVLFGAAEGAEKETIYGIYPFSEANSQEGEFLTLEVPSAQTASEGSFGRGAFPSVGRSKTTSIAFYNVCGGLRFSLSEDGIRKVRFSGNCGEPLAGKVSVRFGENGLPEIAAVEEGATSVSISARDGFRKGEWYFISMLPTVLEKGFTMEFFKRSDESERASRSFSSAVSIKRSVFGSLENVDSGVSYKVGIASLPVSPSAIIMVPGGRIRLSSAISPSDAEYEWVRWSSCNPSVATVDDDGIVTAVGEGECEIRLSSDNGCFGACAVYVSSNLFSTGDATGVESTYATLNGSGGITGFESLEKSLCFLYSSTASTVDALKAAGKRVQARITGSSFSADVSGLSLNTDYYYIAVLETLGKTYYGSVRSFTTKNLPTNAVNLGLSVYWASVNVGAPSPEKCGDYYAWGETTPKSIYSWGTYPLCSGVYNKLKKYVIRTNHGTVDGKTRLDLQDDAAHAALGGQWRMPSRAEWRELQEKCRWTWTILNGVSGYEIASETTGKSIFLPISGLMINGSLEDSAARGYYWSSELGTGFELFAWSLCFDSDNIFGNYGRCHGRQVRPVLDENL